MKKLLIGLCLLATTAFAAENKIVETGLYKAVDVDTKTVDCTLLIRPDQTVNFKVKTEDFSMPEPGCEGKYQVVGALLVADMTCPMEGLETLNVKIDITNVTPETVRSENGAAVKVQLDAFGPDAYDFSLKKID